MQLSSVSDVAGLVVSYCNYYMAMEQNLETPQPQIYMSPRFQTKDYLRELVSQWETKISIPCHCFLLDARFFTEYNIRFDEILPNHVDWDCWLRIFALKPSICYIDAKLAVYRFQSQSMCRDLRRMRRGFLMAIKKQRSSFAGDKVMQGLLDQKRREVFQVYREYAPFYPLRRFVGRIAKTVLPKSCKEYLRKV